MGSAALLYPFLGEDFFPTVDSGQFKLHVRARTGTRIEDMAALCDRIDNTIREIIPKRELVTIIDNIGLPYSGINTSYSNSAPVGPADADIQVSLTEHHHATDDYVARLREELPQTFSWHRVLHAAGRHGDADSELRPAFTDRCTDRGPESGGQPRVRRASAQSDKVRSRYRGHADPAAV